MGGSLIESLTNDLLTVAADSGTPALAEVDDTLDIIGSGGIATSVAKVGTTITVTIDGSGIAGGSPGGSNQQVQFNDSGAFGGDANFTWDKTANELDVNNLNFKANTIAATNATGNILLKAKSGGRVSIGNVDNTFSSASDPALILNEDASAGFYRPSGGETGLSDSSSNSAWLVDDVEMSVNTDQADRNFRVATVAGASSLFVDGNLGLVGLGTASPSTQLHVLGSGSAPVLAGSGSSQVGLFQNSGSAAARATVYIVADDTGVASLLFGDEANAGTGGFAFDNNNDTLLTTAEAARPAPTRTVAQRDAVTSPGEGLMVYATDTDLLNVYDGQRWRNVCDAGWMPYAHPINFVASAAFTTALALAANGGSIAIPVWVDGHMLLESASIRNTDTGTARSWRWDLYAQYLNNGNSGENTLTRVAASNGSDAFTPGGAASTRTLAVTSAPVYIGPGLYWLVIQCTHATNNIGIGSTAASAAFALNTAQTKTTTNPNGSTLDFVAATWTKVTAIYAARLNGRVFGQTTSF